MGEEIPRCTNWRGHKFEGRYSKQLPPNVVRVKMGYADDIELLKTITYERDICVRCGVTVEKKPTGE